MGLIDIDEQIIVPPQFDKTEFFREGFASVQINGKWGVIDREGSWIVPTIYDSIGTFKNGKAKVSLNREIFHMDTQGNLTEYASSSGYFYDDFGKNPVR